MGVQELRDWAGKWGKYLLSMETGEVRPELATNL
jgi:nitrogenase iron protein NifH